jgi:hypothetical protein
MLLCHYWSPYLSERETVLEAQLIGLGLWKIKYRRISTIRIMTLTTTGSSTLLPGKMIRTSITNFFINHWQYKLF